MKVEKKNLLLPLNIQLFADEGNDGGAGQGETKTYSEGDYKKIQDEYAKMKAAFDKASSELAEEKKKTKAKMSEDEKKKADDDERQRQFEEMANKVKKFELKASLSKTFEENEIDGIVEAIVEGDTNKLAELISKSQETYKKKVSDEAKKEFSKSSTVPSGNADEDDENAKRLKELAEKQSKRDSAKNDAWNNYKNR